MFILSYAYNSEYKGIMPFDSQYFIKENNCFNVKTNNF